MTGKNIAIVSYLTFIGWIVAFMSHNNSPNKEPIATFHLRQSLGILLTWFVLNSIPTLLGFGFALSIILPLTIVIWIVGFVYALQGEEKEVPVIGSLYQEWFKGIN